jgi:hypothetical protein
VRRISEGMPLEDEDEDEEEDERDDEDRAADIPY